MKTENVRPVHFLLVEDDEDHADLIRRALSDNHVVNRLTHLTNGRDAIRYMRRESPYENAEAPNVILLDVKLPMIDGHEVLRTFKGDSEFGMIPIVMLTTSQAETDRVRAYELNVNSYLTKPVDFDQFHKMILDLSMYWAVWNTPAMVD